MLTFDTNRLGNVLQRRFNAAWRETDREPVWLLPQCAHELMGRPFVLAIFTQTQKEGSTQTCSQCASFVLSRYALNKSVLGLVQTRKASIAIEALLANSMPYGTEFGGTSMCR